MMIYVTLYYMQVLYGDVLAQRVADDLRKSISGLSQTPKLVILLVGGNSASRVYIRWKVHACAKISIKSSDDYFPADASEESVLAWIAEKNADSSVHAIFVQLPLPQHIDAHRVINAIDPRKDVDGLHPVNMGRLLEGRPTVLPCASRAIHYMLESLGDIAGAHVVIISRSAIVGKPLAMLLSAKGIDATVTICHSRTRTMAEHTRSADILITEIGTPGSITGDMIKDQATIIDVSMNRVETKNEDKPYKITGDVDVDSVSQRVRALSPVPNGVGPMTIAMLLKNTVSLAKGDIQW